MESEYVEFTVGINSSENLIEVLSEEIYVQGCDRGNIYSFIGTKVFGTNSDSNMTSFQDLRKEFYGREKILDEKYDLEKMVVFIHPHKISSINNDRTYRIVKGGAPFQIINNGKW